jgi:membrane-bound metal-dependent hydrolase YbcI (DUF457 family)
MCTPIGHALAGAVIYRGGLYRLGSNIWLLAIILLSANLPDVDFIFGYFEGNPNLYHHTWTHSLAFCLIVGVLAVFVAWPFIGRQSFWIGLLVFGAVLSHLVMDFFTVDQNPPLGIKLFWPITEKYYISPVLIFRDIYKVSTSSGFLRSLLCRHNLITIFFEVVIVGPLFILVHLLYRKRNAGPNIWI